MSELQINTLKWAAKTGFYADYLNVWSRDKAGPRPALYLFAAAHLVDGKKRPGVEQGFIAMLLRDGGATVDEYAAAFNCGPAFNNMRKLVKQAVIKVEPLGGERPQRLKATITERGWHFITQQLKLNDDIKANQQATPAKAPKKAKKAKPDAKPVDPAAAEAQPAEVTVQVDPAVSTVGEQPTSLITPVSTV